MPLSPAQTSRLAANWASVTGRVAAAATRAGRSADGVCVIAVTKTVPADAVLALHALGVRDFGENRVAAGLEKMNACAFPDRGPDAVRWHMIGHLQTNKAKLALGFASIHSVDSIRLAGTLARLAAPAGLAPEVWLEANLAGEASKQGVSEAELPALAECLATVRPLRWRGLMAMAPLADDPEASRPVFRRLREWRDRLAPTLGLSMGMSGDFEVAVEEGATHVRVGTAVWEGVF